MHIHIHKHVISSLTTLDSDSIFPSILHHFGSIWEVIFNDFGRFWGVWRDTSKKPEKVSLPGSLLEAILAPRCAKLEQRSRQVGQLGAKMGPRWPTWRLRWPTWRTFGSILATLFGSWGRSCHKNCENQKNDDSASLLKVFWCPGAALGGYLGSSWRYVGLCCAILAPSWTNLTTKWDPRATR